MGVPVKKVRAFLAKQHRETKAMKREHVAKAVKATEKHKDGLAHKLSLWSNDDGTLKHGAVRESKSWAKATAAALSNVVTKAISSAAEDAADLAAVHAQQWSDFAVDHLDSDEFDLGGSDYEIDEDRIDDLGEAFVGNTRKGVLGTLLKLSTLMSTTSTLADVATSLGAKSDNEEDIADSLFDRVSNRVEMFVRTETGNVYSDAFDGTVSEDDAPQKRWATIDPGCEGICHPTDGQVVDRDDLFELGNDDMVDYPPAHPNCDCTWLPWKEDFGSMKSTDDIEEAA